MNDQTNPQAFTGWLNGDFNYGGAINGSDYTLIDNAFNTHGAQLSSTVAGPNAVVTDQIAEGTSSPVPKPASGRLFAVACIGLLGRYRKQLLQFGETGSGARHMI